MFNFPRHSPCAPCSLLSLRSPALCTWCAPGPCDVCIGLVCCLSVLFPLGCIENNCAILPQHPERHCACQSTCSVSSASWFKYNYHHWCIEEVWEGFNFLSCEVFPLIFYFVYIFLSIFMMVSNSKYMKRYSLRSVEIHIWLGSKYYVAFFLLFFNFA